MWKPPKKYHPKNNSKLLLLYMKEVMGITITWSQMYNSSKTGELWHVFVLTREAVKHYYPKGKTK